MSSVSRKIEVCLTPALIHLYELQNTTAVIIDILRASSSICVALHHGVNSIVPVSSTEESMAYREQGYLVGAERNGEMLAGFDLGNSPFSYMESRVMNRDIALTTTNGTRALHAASGADQIVVGSFLNISVLCDWLIAQERNVLLLCAGWKNSFNLEDTLFAGAVFNRVKHHFSDSLMKDSALAAEVLYENAKDDLYGFLAQSSHRKRLERLQIEEDIAFCLSHDKAPVIPVLRQGRLVCL